MNDDLKITHTELMNQVRSIMEAVSDMDVAERLEILDEAGTLMAKLEDMKV